MAFASDRKFAKKYHENEIAREAYRAAERKLDKSILGNPDAVMALELQKMEVQLRPRPTDDEESERIAVQLQEEEDAYLAQRLFDEEERLDRIRRGDDAHERLHSDSLFSTSEEETQSSINSSHDESSTDYTDVSTDTHGTDSSSTHTDSSSTHTDTDNTDTDGYNSDDSETDETEEEDSGLTSPQVDCLPIYKFKAAQRQGTYRNDCGICLSEYFQGQFIKALPCFHSFHKDCVDQWLKSRSVCPVCRKTIDIGTYSAKLL